MENCSKNGIKRLGESCTLNNNCIYPNCLEKEVLKKTTAENDIENIKK